MFRDCNSFQVCIFFAIICKQAKNGSAMKEKLKDEEPAYSPPPSSPKPTENLEETESVLLGMVLVMHGEGRVGVNTRPA